MIVVGKDGFIDWAWGSDRLFKSGIFYRGRQETIPLPEQSLARRRDPSINSEAGVIHPKGIWIGNEEVHEMTIFGSKTNMTVSLLLYSDTPPLCLQTDTEPEEDLKPDTYDRFGGRGSS
jgi:hypothetical protein